MVKTLKELVENRRDLIEAHRKNDFTDGIHALLTDLYPDSTHCEVVGSMVREK